MRIFLLVLFLSLSIIGFAKTPYFNAIAFSNTKIQEINKKANESSKLTHKANDTKRDFTVRSDTPNERAIVLYSIKLRWNELYAENRDLILPYSSNNYEIRLKMANENPGTIQTINVRVQKPFLVTPLFLATMAIIFLLLSYVFYKRKISKIEQKNKLLLDKINLQKNLDQAKLKAIKSQMNPHFFFNALNTLQSYILSNEKKQAVNYLLKFSNLMRTILEMTEKDFISIKEEIKILEPYLEIEKVRFEMNFSYTIRTNSEFENDQIKIPTMLLQPYIENSLKHGLLHKKGEKELNISFEKINDIIKITIDDNGIGRNKSAELNAIKRKNDISLSSDPPQNRIDLLNQYNNKNITLTIVDKYNSLKQSLGTQVIFEIPISY